MMRERLAGLVVRAYPDGAPTDELAGTALDVGAESRARFARELAGLTRAGLHERARRTASVGPARLVFDGLCLAAVWLMTLELSVGLAQRTGRGMSDPLLAWPLMALLAAALSLALVGFDRAAGIVVLVWSVARFPALVADRDSISVLAGVGEMLLASAFPVALFGVLVARPRQRRPDARRLVYLAVPLTLVATFGPPDYLQSPLLRAFVLVAAVAVVVVAIAALPTDPRLALAGAVLLTAVGAGVTGKGPIVVAVALILSAPLVIAFTILRTRRLARLR